MVLGPLSLHIGLDCYEASHTLAAGAVNVARHSRTQCHLPFTGDNHTLTQETWNIETVFTTPCLSHVTCHMSRVTCHVSGVRCHMSGVTCQIIIIIISTFFFYTWHLTCDMWHVTCDTWHVTLDTWHVTCDTWHIGDCEHCVKISGP